MIKDIKYKIIDYKNLTYKNGRPKTLYKEFVRVNIRTYNGIYDDTYYTKFKKSNSRFKVIYRSVMLDPDKLIKVFPCLPKNWFSCLYTASGYIPEIIYGTPDNERVNAPIDLLKIPTKDKILDYAYLYDSFLRRYHLGKYHRNYYD